MRRRKSGLVPELCCSCLSLDTAASEMLRPSESWEGAAVAREREEALRSTMREIGVEV